MRFVRVNKIFKNYAQTIKILGNQFASPLIYRCWLSEFSKKKNIKIIKKLNSYLNFLIIGLNIMIKNFNPQQ